MNLNQVVILVGGRGTRLKNLTKKIPKPLIKISGKPFLDYLIDFYSANNIWEYTTAMLLFFSAFNFLLLT